MDLMRGRCVASGIVPQALLQQSPLMAEEMGGIAGRVRRCTLGAGDFVHRRSVRGGRSRRIRERLYAMPMVLGHQLLGLDEPVPSISVAEDEHPDEEQNQAKNSPYPQ